ncbi:GspE/PulE family protein [Evansella cellulosilytica]|uniref:Type II secretion system protein E n=1 Tax=Evansella cellulosilytica (strain ATCC 21833 / DSM 2522 / FERM P-1141 / JCM 9156 / N-4) TaxID=649639 RepID=E6TZP0_EVAC2|nr:GspE/PulE family protein [Evansella cellulosilytica]ADU31346.1 type II secretion system protein E [Evansella cellulosilytica DSM 2522]
MNQSRKRLGDLLVETGLISKEQLEEALEQKTSNQKLGDVLLQQGYITEQQLIEVLEYQLGIPHVSLYRYPIDPKMTNLVPKEIANTRNLMPLKLEGDKLFIAMADPMDFFAIDDIRLSTGFEVEVAIATKDDILKAIHKYYELEDTVEELFEEMPSTDDKEMETLIENDSPMVKLVNQLLLRAVQERASDIHIDTQESKVIIRYRVDGVLKTERTLPKHMQNMLIARIKIMGNLDITESRIPQDGRIKVNIDFHPIDLRISTLPTVYGEKIVMRILDLGNSLNDLEKLGFSEKHYEQLTEMLDMPNGIVLITGPTGSGKSSTLYASLNRLNSEQVNIITVEDPVEYQLEGINQIQVNTKVGMTFASGLRSILRQDPDIIMVGEIRDSETAEIAVRASLTGHLVLSTIHTNDSISTINRLVDMKIEPFLLAASLSGIVSQRLVRKICRDCKKEHELTLREKAIFSKRGIEVDKVYRGEGCPTCNMTGYRDRIAIHEMLVLDDEIKHMIMNEKSSHAIKEYALKKGMSFLVDDGLEKVKLGLTTTEEVLRVATDK